MAGVGGRLASITTAADWSLLKADMEAFLSDTRNGLEPCSMEMESSGGRAASWPPKEQMFGNKGARTKLSALLSRSPLLKSHMC